MARKVPPPGRAGVEEPDRGRDPDEGWAAGDQRENEGDEAEQQRARHAGDREAHGSDRALDDRRAHDAVDDAFRRRARDRDQPLAATARNPLHGGCEMHGRVAAVAVEKEAGEDAQGELERGRPDARAAAKRPVARLAEMRLDRGAHRRPVMCKAHPVGLQLGADERHVGDPGRRCRQPLVQEEADDLEDAGDMVGEREAENGERHHQHRGDDKGHQRGRERHAALEATHQTLIKRPGREGEDDRPEQCREKRPQHDKAAQHQQHEKRDPEPRFESLGEPQRLAGAAPRMFAPGAPGRRLRGRRIRPMMGFAVQA